MADRSVSVRMMLSDLERRGEKNEWWGYRAVKEAWRYLQSSGYNPRTLTDRRLLSPTRKKVMRCWQFTCLCECALGCEHDDSNVLYRRISMTFCGWSALVTRKIRLTLGGSDVEYNPGLGFGITMLSTGSSWRSFYTVVEGMRSIYCLVNTVSTKSKPGVFLL